MSYFSKNLKYIREKNGYSQNKLAELANVNQTTIARWENENISPSLDNIYDLANALNISIADLTGKNIANEDINFDELEILYSKNKKVLSEDDKDMIRFVIEKRKREINKQLGKE